VGRGDLALREPAHGSYDFSKFPRKTHRAASRWYRQHVDRPMDTDRGAWYFASHTAAVVGGGRFDLTNPHGTCYLATTEQGAVNECIGPEVAERGWVDADLVEGRVLSTLDLPWEVRAADMTSARAPSFRITNEIHSTGDYQTTQAWAQTLHDNDFGGVHYELRFTPGRSRGLALFSDGGAPATKPAGDPDPSNLREVVEARGIEVVDPPSFSSARVVAP
jgi:hypothetical protein